MYDMLKLIRQMMFKMQTSFSIFLLKRVLAMSSYLSVLVFEDTKTMSIPEK